MAGINVGELREILDTWGDHVPVAIVVENGDNYMKIYKNFNVDDRNLGGELFVMLEIETGSEEE